MKSGNTSEKIATKIVNLVLTIQCKKNKVFILGLAIRKITISVKGLKSKSSFGKKMLVGKIRFH